MPNKAVTIGIKQILGARKVRLGVFREWHRAVVRQAAYGEVTAAFPATLAPEPPGRRHLCQRHRRQASPSERHAMEKTALYQAAASMWTAAFSTADLLVEDGRIAAYRRT